MLSVLFIGLKYVFVLALVVIVGAVLSKHKGKMGLAVCFVIGWVVMPIAIVMLSPGSADVKEIFLLVIAIGVGLGAGFYGMERYVETKSIGMMVAWGLLYSIPVGLLTPFALLIFACMFGDCL